MANLSLISVCNRKCSYCFAADTMQRAGSERNGMSLDLCEQALDVLDRSGIPEVRLLGGEPTIHPRFIEIVERVRARGKPLLLFTGGMIPHLALECLAAIPPGEVRVLLNVAFAEESPAAEVQRQREVCRRLGERVALGVNIHSPSTRLDVLLDWIDEFQLARVVRMGLTHPSLEGDNRHLHPRFFELVGRQVADFARVARDRDVRLDFDCGWVPCMFPEGSLAELGITPQEVGLRCNPILDILPDGQVIPCYPLASQFTESLADHATVQSLADRFVERLAPLRPLGIFKKCADCDFRARGECSGGCLSLSMRRLRGGTFPVSLPSATDQPSVPAAPHASLTVLSDCGSGGCGCHDACDVPTAPARLLATLPILSLPSVALPTSSACGQESPAVVRDSGASAPRNDAAGANRWSLPYIDQPAEFWEQIQAEFGPHVAHVYFPLPVELIGSGRPPQPREQLSQFLASKSLSKAVLLNAVTLPRPVQEILPPVLEALQRLHGEFGVREAVVADLLLARRLRDALPEFSLTASVLMEISEPYQARLLTGVCDTLVPASRTVRDLAALRALREAFPGRIRLLVNEACLPGCPHRTQHFHEMSSGIAEPKSLCVEGLQAEPWLRLTGSWVLPQHLVHFDGLYDELKLAGRVTLRDPDDYRHVLRSYIHRRRLRPNEIGGGPASVLEPIEMSDELFAFTLSCGRRCHACTRCPDYYAEAVTQLREESRRLDAELEPVTTCW
jgi:MoaA/NifB/PqqE/SkfB family radical SAM enzyme